MRYFAYITYDGTNYHGWQTQPNGNTIQAEINHALSTILRTPTQATGAGRTDTGVSATEMVIHFDADQIDTQHTQQQLNSILPHDIAINKIIPVKNNAHARYNATSRTYQYHVCLTKNPIAERHAYRIPPDTDFEAMNNAAQILLQTTDFTSFSKLHTDVKNNLCTVTHAQWQHTGDTWTFTIQANRFLRNMVRAIVGTLLEIGRHRITNDDLRNIILKKNRCAAAMSVPAKALFLTKITYPDDIFLT